MVLKVYKTKKYLLFRKEDKISFEDKSILLKASNHRLSQGTVWLRLCLLLNKIIPNYLN